MVGSATQEPLDVVDELVEVEVLEEELVEVLDAVEEELLVEVEALLSLDEPPPPQAAKTAAPPPRPRRPRT